MLTPSSLHQVSHHEVPARNHLFSILGRVSKKRLVGKLIMLVKQGM
jgi:hypothetical protein